MQLFRFGEVGNEKPGVFFRGKKYDVSAFGKDYDEKFFSENSLTELQQFINVNIAALPVVADEVRMGAPVCRPSKIICIGLNYRDHAIETKAAIPAEPIIFFKAQTAICGPFDDVIIPPNSKKTDWEVELAVVIAKEASYIKKEEAEDYIAGYMLHNDYSERAYQLERGGQWVKGKSCNSFAPLGPYFVTPDELPNVNNLRMWLKVNGKIMQESNTGQMIFDVPFIIHYLSQFMTLLPGDIISTGTPHGVGLGFTPPIYLKHGDYVELGIDGLGTSAQKAKSSSNE